MGEVENLELAVFVAGGEDVVATMLPAQSVGHGELRRHVDAGIVPPSVLHHHGLYLVGGHDDFQRAVADFHLHLLVAAVDVEVGIGGIAKADAHQRLHNHEACHEHGLLAVVLVDDGEPVVAAHLQAAVGVGNLQVVVVVQLYGVHRHPERANGVALGKSLQVFA